MDVVLGFSVRKRSAHHREQPHLAFHQIAAGQRAPCVSLGIEQPREIRTETDLNDDHSSIRFPRQHAPQQADCFGSFASIYETMRINERLIRALSLRR